MSTEKRCILENSTGNDFQLITIIKERIIVELSNRQAIMQASVHSSKAKQAGAKLTDSTRRHHVRRGYCSRHGKTHTTEQAYEHCSTACGEVTLTVQLRSNRVRGKVLSARFAYQA